MGLEPSRLSDFKLNRPIGAGSTAQVFDALHLGSGRHVAIKILEQEASGSAELRERLAREAVILAGVESRHVGRILGFGYDNDQPFLVLERLIGETLDVVIKREGQLQTKQIVQWVEQLLIGVRDIHAVGVVHRDLKPSNVFIQGVPGEERIVKIIDFGVARLREIASVGVSLTQTHHLIGSMGYMAPEQFLYAKGVGPQADLYALGVVVFKMISGRLPFVHRSLEQVIKMKCEQEPPLLSSMHNIVCIRALDEWVARALARDVARRFQSAREMLDEWWNVVTYIDQDAPLTIDPSGLDVVFEDEDPLLKTLLEGGGTQPSATERTPRVAIPDAVPPSYQDTVETLPGGGGQPSSGPSTSEPPTNPRNAQVEVGRRGGN
jgi:eukaryotic-like serine/threonine-protein kinase